MYTMTGETYESSIFVFLPNICTHYFDNTHFFIINVNRFLLGLVLMRSNDRQMCH